MEIKEILELFKGGGISAERAEQLLSQDDGFDFAKIDYLRKKRTGFPEVIFCKGKTDEQICAIMRAMNDRGTEVILATKATQGNFDKVTPLIKSAEFFPSAGIIRVVNRQPDRTGGVIAVLTGGTADIPVAEEAAVTAESFGNDVLRIYDVGVAGLHRLLGRLEEIRRADVVIAVAGMEGALGSVVGGLVDAPVIAVPTSVGYGSSFGGISALLTMLNSCAAGSSVVNIDNGFGAGFMAASIIRTWERHKNREEHN